MSCKLNEKISYSWDEVNDILSNGNPLDYDDIDILLDAAIVRPQPEANACLRKAILILNEKENKTQNDDFCLGYAWYYLSSESTDEDLRNKMVEMQLEKSLSRGKDFANYFYAKYLLGCQYFDTKQYRKSLSIFSTFKAKFFQKYSDQAWKDIKIAELKLCCILKLNKADKIKKNIEMLYDAFKNYGEQACQKNDDTLFMSIADPTELIQTLKEILNEHGKT